MAAPPGNVESPNQLSCGTLLRERYRILAPVGEGAHGVTYLARHEFLNHPCVLKVLPHRIESANDQAVRRMRSEARAGFRLNHPNVVRVMDFDSIQGLWYFVMEYVDGINLADLIATGVEVSWRQALRIALDAASGLSAVHEVGLVHRDITPANLLLDVDGRTKVADLGIADALDSQGGSPAGTLYYVPPEVVGATEPIDGRFDLFSLGATLYHLLLGRPPHPPRGVLTHLLDLQRRRAEWPTGERADVPGWFSGAILRCLESEPADRFGTAEELGAYLRRSAALEAETAQPTSVRRLTPGGVGVLRFENAGGAAADDWLGFAVAEFLAARFAEVPGVYVADRDQLLRTVAEPGSSAPDAESRYAAVGRRVGAGTIITGRVWRREDTIELAATIHRTGDPVGRELGPVVGTLAGFAALQGELFEALVGALGMKQESGPAVMTPSATSVAPEALERYVTGRRAYLAGDYQGARRSALSAIELDPNYAEALGFLGACCARLGRYDEAAEYDRRLERLAQQRGDLRLLVEALAGFGGMYYFKGDYRRAREFYDPAAETARQVGLLAELASIDNNRGYVLLRLRELSGAAAAFSSSIDIHRAYGALMSLVAPYNGIGNVLMEQRRFAEAAGYFRQALALAHEIGDRAKVGVTHMNLARCAAALDDYHEASTEFALAFTALEETTFWNGLTRAYEYVAEMNLRRRLFDEAMRCVDKRIDLAERHANRSMESAAWRQKAVVLRLMGRSEEARRCWRRSCEMRSEPPSART